MVGGTGNRYWSAMRRKPFLGYVVRIRHSGFKDEQNYYSYDLLVDG